MAQLTVAPDATSPSGGFVVRADHPSALAAIPDALVQVLDLQHDVGSVWALHPSEQTGTAAVAYADERAELGPGAAVQVVELTRPRQTNVVWVDRFHLVGSFQPATLASRLLGLYAGGPGALALYVHHPSVAASFAHAVQQAPVDGGSRWNAAALVGQSRFAVRYDGRAPHEVRVACTPSLQAQVAQALQQLAGVVAGW